MPDKWVIIAYTLSIIGIIIGLYNLWLRLEDKKKWKNRFTISYEPEPQGEVMWPNNSDYKIKVKFFCKVGNVVVNRIWQHQGGVIGVARMTILNPNTKESIIPAENHVFVIEENIQKIITLSFKKDEGMGSKKLIGFQIETSEGIFKKEFNLTFVEP